MSSILKPVVYRAQLSFSASRRLCVKTEAANPLHSPTPTIHNRFQEIGFVPSIWFYPLHRGQGLNPVSSAADCTSPRVRAKLGDKARSDSVLLALLLLFAASSSFDDSFRAGLLALQRGDLASARANLEAAGKLAPRDGRVWVALSQTYWRLHKDADAQDAAGKAAAFGPEDPTVLQGLSIYYSETNQTLKAAQAAAKYSAKVPENGDARERATGLYFDAARPLLDQQKFTEAAGILKEGAARLPNSAQLELALGVADYGLRRFDDAADAFLRTIEIAPETEQPYSFLGRILDQIPSRLPQVTERFAEYEAAHPASAAGYLLHAKALDAQSLSPEMALRLLEKSIAMNAGDASAHFEMGTVLDRLQRFADAVAEFQRVAELAPLDAAAHYRLARDYDRIGKHEAAQAEREKHAQLIKAQEPIR
jgi:tetratricopeptide (TPR) repeat protein